MSPPPGLRYGVHQGRAVAGGDEDEPQLRVVGDGIPGRAAAADLPPLPLPGLGRHGHGLVLEALGRVAGHDVEAPERLARVGVVGAHEAARAEVRAAVADHHLAVEHPRRAGDGVGLSLLEGLGGPDRPARAGAERDQPPVQGGDDDLALPGGQAPAHRLAAGVAAPFAGDLGVIGPKRLARARVVGGDDVPGADVVEHAVDEQGRALHAAIGVEVGVPGQAELADVGRVDLGERAVALGRIGAPVRQPLPGLARGVSQPRRVDGGGTGVPARERHAREARRRQGEHERAAQEPGRGLSEHGAGAPSAPADCRARPALATHRRPPAGSAGPRACP